LEYTLSSANPVPAPPAVVLAAVGVFGLLGGRAVRRRTSSPAAA
jgi:hypothetical protein